MQSKLTSLIISSLTTRFTSTFARWIERSDGPANEFNNMMRIELGSGIPYQAYLIYQAEEQTFMERGAVNSSS